MICLLKVDIDRMILLLVSSVAVWAGALAHKSRRSLTRLVSVPKLVNQQRATMHNPMLFQIETLFSRLKK